MTKFITTFTDSTTGDIVTQTESTTLLPLQEKQIIDVQVSRVAGDTKMIAYEIVDIQQVSISLYGRTVQQTISIYEIPQK